MRATNKEAIKNNCREEKISKIVHLVFASSNLLRVSDYDYVKRLTQIFNAGDETACIQDERFK